MKNEKEYVPFGEEWKNEVKKLDKNTLITMWRKSLLELRDLKFNNERDIKDYNEQVDNMKGALRFLCSKEHIEQDAYTAHIERYIKHFNL